MDVCWVRVLTQWVVVVVGFEAALVAELEGCEVKLLTQPLLEEWLLVVAVQGREVDICSSS